MKKFLVATDLSSRADRAVLRAIKLAEIHQAHLTIIHIIDEDTPRAIIDEHQKIAKQEINHLIKGKIKNIKHDIKIIVGVSHSSILEIITQENIDLIILGLHRHTSKEQPIIGSVIDRIVKNSLKPILIVKDSAGFDYKNILVGVDFNIHSKKSLKISLEMFADSKFNLIHSYQMPFLGALGQDISIEKELKNSCAKELDDMIKEVIASLKPTKTNSKEVVIIKKSTKNLAKNTFDIHKKIVKGAILEILKEEILYAKPNLLVLGTHGRSGLSRMLSLNITEHFLINPSCDILVVS